MSDDPNDPTRTSPAEPSAGDTLTNPAPPPYPSTGTLTGGPPRAAAPGTQTGDGVPPPPHADPADPPPGYEILGELGRGAMGAVVRAMHTGLRREVALKVVTGGGTALRFAAEAQAVAAVRHPNVVQIFDVGTHHGRPYMAMEFCPGGSLAGRMRRDPNDPPRPYLPPREAAALVEKIARGVAAAHAEGIVHRDLKPGNVLFDAAGEPKVADFGLAKRVDVHLTATEAVMGTPAYMAPEQAAGKTKFAGPPADVWALGVMLHEQVAGSRPFGGETAQETMFHIMMTAPPPLRSVARHAPRDLDTVVAKCLTKEPDLRYATAKELADDLGRFVRGEPIVARPVGVVEGVVRWVRRKPTAAAAWALGLAVLVAGSFAVTAASLWRQAEDARGKAVDALAGESEAKGKAEDALEGERAAKGTAEVALKGEREAKRLAEQALAGEKVAKEKAEVAFLAEKSARRKAEVAEEGERRARQQVAFLNYAHSVDLAYREYQAVNVGRARELLAGCPAELRGWEWHHCRQLCHVDLATLAGHTRTVSAASFSPDGRQVVTASEDHTARVWDPATGKEVAVLRGHHNAVTSASFSPDGGRVVTASIDGTARVWDIHTSKEVAVFRGHKDTVTSASFSPDGGRVVTGSGDRTARVWDLATGKEVTVIRAHTAWVYSASFSPNGGRVLTAGDRTACVWDAHTGKEVAVLSGHTSFVFSASFSPDGGRVVTGSDDGTARVWDPATGREMVKLTGHANTVCIASFSPDGRRAITGSFDNTVRIWDTDSGKLLLTLSFSKNKDMYQIGFNHDAARLIVLRRAANDKAVDIHVFDGSSPPTFAFRRIAPTPRAKP